VPEIPEPVEPRAQLGWALVIGGLAALIGTPIVYRLRAANANVSPARNWLWPTWWMLVPLAVVIIGLLIARVPESFDLRRSLLRSRLFARRRGR
jgi:uncharacterized protein YybS (DUF2232 family)